MPDKDPAKRIRIPEDVWPSDWRRSYVVDLLLADGRVVHSAFARSDGEIWGQAEPIRGEPGPISDAFDPSEIVAIKLRGGWRDWAGLRRLFPHRWQHKRKS